MDEILSQGGELLIGIASALVMISAVLLLLSPADAGVLRHYMTVLLEAAC